MILKYTVYSFQATQSSPLDLAAVCADLSLNSVGNTGDDGGEDSSSAIRH